MNNAKRKKIKEVITFIEFAKKHLQLVQNEEEMDFDNLAENLQGSRNGEAMEEAIESMDNAQDSLDEAIDYLKEIL